MFEVLKDMVSSYKHHVRKLAVSGPDYVDMLTMNSAKPQ